MYSHLNLEIISTICDDNLWVSINQEEDDQQDRQWHCHALIYLGNLCRPEGTVGQVRTELL